MRPVRLALAFAAVFSMLPLIGSVPAQARGVRCEDIARERARGKTAEEIETALGTTRTRIEACARLQTNRVRHERRRARIIAAQEQRRQESD